MSLTHETVVIERRFAAAPAGVFAAWEDPAGYGSWLIPEGDWGVEEFSHAFAPGGELFARYGRMGDPPVQIDGWFAEIETDALVVLASTTRRGEVVVGSGLASFAFQSEAAGTRMVLTESWRPGRAGRGESRQAYWEARLQRLARALGEA